MPAATLLDKLKGVKKAGHDKWMACCPAHDDRSPSLAIRELADGRVLIHCFAQCSPLDIVQAVGLELDSLFPPKIDDDKRGSRIQRFSNRELVSALQKEMVLTHLLLNDLLSGRPVGETDRVRAKEAMRRSNLIFNELSKS